MQHERAEREEGLALAANPLVRVVLIMLGGLCVVAGIIGLFLPGWPTTIWLIVAAWLFSRSSPRFYAMIINHPTFGPIVRDYRAGNGIPGRVKLLAISCITLFAGTSAFLLIGSGLIRLGVVAAAMFGIGFLSGVPTRAPYGRG